MAKKVTPVIKITVPVAPAVTPVKAARKTPAEIQKATTPVAPVAPVKTVSMLVRTKEEIEASMKKNGLLDKKGSYTGKLPVITVDPNVIATERKTRIVTGATTSRKQKREKQILITEKINDYSVKLKMFQDALAVRYGDQYDAEKNSVKFVKNGKTISVSVIPKEMKMRSKSTSNTVGICANVVRNENKYVFTEYAGKFSVEQVANKINEYADLESPTTATKAVKTLVKVVKTPAKSPAVAQ